MAATYAYKACILPGTEEGLATVNALGEDGWKVIHILPLHANLGERIGHGSSEFLVISEKVTERNFEHLMVALEELLSTVTINTSQD